MNWIQIYANYFMPSSFYAAFSEAIKKCHFSFWLAEAAQNQVEIRARVGRARVIYAKRLCVVAAESENDMD